MLPLGTSVVSNWYLLRSGENMSNDNYAVNAIVY